jgi:hypothetical protein
VLPGQQRPDKEVTRTRWFVPASSPLAWPFAHIRADPRHWTSSDGSRWPSGRRGRDIIRLTARVRTRLERMQNRPGLLHGFLASTGLDLTPFCNSHN